MMRPALLTTLALVLVAGLLLTLAPSAQADTTPGIRTRITILAVPPLTIGDHPTITARLMTKAGEPIDDEPLTLYLDGERQRRKRTDSSGGASFRIRRDLSVGTYTIKVEYRGSSYLTPSSAARQFIIRPAPFEISTVPPLPGARFSLDGRLLITDEGGIARTEVSQVKSYHLKYLPSEEQSEDVRFQFSRWGDEVFAPSREVNIPQKASLEAGFNLSYRVTLHFHDLEGERVPPSRVSSVTLKSSHSGSFVLEENSPQWFQANRVVRRRSGLEVTPLMYSIERVEVDGVNVVNRAQQRFFADPNDTWPIELLLHSAHFTAQDALFGFPIGSGIHLLHPDGRREDISFGPQDDVTIHSLARGLYSVRVAGALGYAPDTPVALSRDQDVSLLVLSYLDMAVAALLGATAVLGLLFLGRPHLLAKLRLRLSWMLQLPRLLWSGRE